jgi:citrate lyase subunit beta-like protein
MFLRIKIFKSRFLLRECKRFMSDGPAIVERKYIPRRSLMYVPGNDERKINKIPQLVASGADCICLDCEDGVAINKKEEARNSIRKILDEQKLDFGKSECTVRINSVGSGFEQIDMETILSGPHLPSSVHLPKVENLDHLEWFAAELNSVIQSNPVQKIGLIMFIETAEGLLNIKEICRKALELSDDSFFVPEALVFGSDDFAADIGATRTQKSTELFYARQAVVTAAKAFKLQAIDLVYIDYKDLDGLEQQSLEGAGFGFTGKQVIHPGQISIVQQAFTPPKHRIEWATQLIKEFEENQEAGAGAFVFRGQMIDMPTVKQAQNVLQLISKDK